MPANPTAAPSAPAKSDPAASTPATSAPAAETPATSAPTATAPATATPEAKGNEPPKTPTTHVVVAGDTLWDLAKTYYGSASQWHKLVAANRNIKPHHLSVGEKLKIPAK
jgi:5'-nucleotidase